MCLRSDILDDKIEHRLSICGVQKRFSSMPPVVNSMMCVFMSLCYFTL